MKSRRTRKNRKSIEKKASITIHWPAPKILSSCPQSLRATTTATVSHFLFRNLR